VPSRAFVALLGILAVAWSVGWILVGIWTRHEVQTLRKLSGTVVTSGVAVKQTGDALQGLGAIPFVGADVARVGRQVSTAGVSAQRSGRQTRDAVRRLSNLLGISIALIPSVPMLALFVVTVRLRRRL
jgi:hypothetical protein